MKKKPDNKAHTAAPENKGEAQKQPATRNGTLKPFERASAGENIVPADDAAVLVIPNGLTKIQCGGNSLEIGGDPSEVARITTPFLITDGHAFEHSAHILATPRGAAINGFTSLRLPDEGGFEIEPGVTLHQIDGDARLTLIHARARTRINTLSLIKRGIGYILSGELYAHEDNGDVDIHKKQNFKAGIPIYIENGRPSVYETNESDVRIILFEPHLPDKAGDFSFVWACETGKPLAKGVSA